MRNPYIPDLFALPNCRVVSETTARLVGTAIAILYLLLPAALLAQPTLDAPDRVAPGERFTVDWTGPNEPADFIALSSEGAPLHSFSSYARTSSGSPATILAPDTPGQMEIRYVSGRRQAILAVIPVEIGGTESSWLTAPERVVADAKVKVEVGVTVETSSNDFVTIAPAGAPATRIGPYARLRGGPGLVLAAPSSPGDYELRLVRARDMIVIAAQPLTVIPAPDSTSAARTAKATPATSVSIYALPIVAAGSQFHIHVDAAAAVQGRLVVAPQRKPEEPLVAVSVPASGTARLRAPTAPGDYVIGYGRTGSDKFEAKRRLVVE